MEKNSSAKLQINFYTPITNWVFALITLIVALCFISLSIFSTKKPSNELSNYIFFSSVILIFSFAILGENLTKPVTKISIFDHSFLLTLYYLPYIKKSYSFKLKAIEDLSILTEHDSDGDPTYKLQLSVGEFKKLTIHQSNIQTECLNYKSKIDAYIDNSHQEIN